MSVHKLLPLLALLLNVLLLGSALAAARKSHRHYVFALLAGAFAVWNLGVFGLRGSGDPATALTWERFLHYGVIPIPVLFSSAAMRSAGASSPCARPGCS